MKFQIKSLALAVATLPLIAFALVAVTPSNALAEKSDTKDCPLTITGGKDCAQGAGVSDKGLFEENGIFQTITNVLLFLIGAVSVIMLIIGGFRYVISNGDSSQVTAAKNTILYAVIGIIVALLAYAIVGFVVKSFTTSGSGSGDGGRTTTGR